MKKIFAFAMAVVAMASVMTSCNNDDAEFIEQKAPVTTVRQEAQEMNDICLVVAVTPEQKEYFDDIYTVQTSGEIQTVMVSEMTPATQEQINAFKAVPEITNAFEEKAIEFYSFKLSEDYSCSSTKILSRSLEAKANHPTEEFDFLNAACIYFNGRVVNSKTDIRLFKGLHGNDDEVRGFARVLCQYTK